MSYFSDYFGGAGGPIAVPQSAAQPTSPPLAIVVAGAQRFVPRTLAVLRADVARRLGDLAYRIWSADEIDQYLTQAYREIATSLPMFFDWLYLENLPRGASYTQPWERAYLPDVGGFDYGCGNYTARDDRRALGDERQRIGPASHTSPFEATDGYLASLPRWPGIPATAAVPTRLTRLDRATWDGRVTDVLEARTLSRTDAQYETTTGPVDALLWELDGVQTVRKYRVPARVAATATIDGAWGILRRPTDLSADTVTGSWGVPRRIPGEHPLGPERFGLPRRPYRDGTNVRLEHFRLGRPFELGPCELPERYADYLRDYALWQAILRPGPGQDLKLAAYFQQRWARNLARLERRVRQVDTEVVGVLGGSASRPAGRPPRPSLPASYGASVS